MHSMKRIEMHNLLVYLKVLLLINANSLLYYLGKLPIIKRLITPNLYKNTQSKVFFSFFGTLLDLIKSTLAQTILVVVFVRYIPLLLHQQSLGDAPSIGVETSLFVLLFCILPSFLQSSIFQGSKGDYTFLNHFSINPDEYYRVKNGSLLIRQAILLFPAMLFLFQDFLITLSLLGVKLACTMLGNMYFLNQYRVKRRIGSVKLRFLAFASLVVLTYVGVYFDRIPGIYPSEITAIVVFLISLVITTIGLNYVVHYQNFKEIAVQYASKDVIALRISVTTALNEDDTGLVTSDWSTNKEYWERNKIRRPATYIENTFNDRLRRPISGFTKQTIIRNLILLVGAGILIRTGVIRLDETNLMKYSPILISFVMSMTYGVSYLQLCFRNLDLPLLYHHLYTRETIVESMRKRFIFLVRNGLLLLSAFALSLFLFLQIAEIHLTKEILLGFMTVSVLVFLVYELYHLLIYYALQPYSSELSVKSPIFSILTVLESLFGVYFLFARANILHLILPLSVIAAGLLVCNLLLTMFIDKTFKLRY